MSLHGHKFKFAVDVHAASHLGMYHGAGVLRQDGAVVSVTELESSTISLMQFLNLF